MRVGATEDFLGNCPIGQCDPVSAAKSAGTNAPPGTLADAVFLHRPLCQVAFLHPDFVDGAALPVFLAVSSTKEGVPNVADSAVLGEAFLPRPAPGAPPCRVSG